MAGKMRLLIAAVLTSAIAAPASAEENFAQKAVKANAGYRAVSIVPETKDGHPTAEVTLLQGEAFKKVAEKLD